jgi:imidazolonepropionase-like amidohydrolase
MRDLGIIPDGAVLIRGGRIEEVGPARRVENLALARRAVREIDAGGRVVMPGFVDCLAHPVHASPWAPHPARPFLAGMALHGTTTVEARPCPEDGPADRLKVLRRLGALDGKPLDIVPACYGPLTPALAAALGRHKLARFLCLDPGMGAPEGFAVKFRGSAAEAVRAGAPAVEGLENFSAADVAVLARSFTVAVVLPGTRVCAAARALIDGGCAVAIATGFHPQHSPGYSMQTAISLACSRMHLTPAEAVCAATVNAAWACGSAARAGSLEPGKDADLLLLNASDYRELPYYFGVNNVHLTVKRGEIV